MKNFVLMMLTLMLASCTGSVQHPEFENNVKLGQKFFQLHGEENFEAIFPPINLCGDNAAMIAWVGGLRLLRGQKDKLDMQAKARWSLEEMKIHRRINE